MLSRVRAAALKAGYQFSWAVLGTLFQRQGPEPLELVYYRCDPDSAGLDGGIWQSPGPAIVEPMWGYVLSAPWNLSSTSLDTLRGIPTWRYGVPSPFEWARLSKDSYERVLDVEEIVSLRHLYEWNYYHFTFDVLAKVALLDRIGFASGVPLLLGPSVGDLPYLQQIIDQGSLSDRPWIVQGPGQYVRAQRVTVVRPQLPHRERAEFLVQQMVGARAHAVSSGDRRVFLIRRPPQDRLIHNLAEVASALDERGFETVDTATMTVDEQVQLFVGTRHLVAIHGAGITNIAYRAGGQMSVTELCNDPHLFGDDFRNLAFGLDFDFQRLCFPTVGGDTSPSCDIIVDLDRLLPAVDRYLEADS
jgi:hypothetical protein